MLAAGPGWLVLRPVAVRVVAPPATGGDDALPGIVRDVAFRGTGFSYRIELPELGVHAKAESRTADAARNVDDPVDIEWDAAACWLLTDDACSAGAPALVAETAGA